MAVVDPALLPPQAPSAPWEAQESTAVDLDGERELVERARTEADAFAALYRRYLPRVHAFAYRRCGSRERAEDVTAATFEQALRALGSFSWRSGGFAPWLFAIAANELVDHHRADQRASGRRDARAAGAAALLAGVADDRAWCDGPDLHVPPDRLRSAMATLHPRYQRAVSLRYLSGLSHAEAAEAMGATKPVMAVTLHRALKALRRALDDADPKQSPRANQKAGTTMKSIDTLKRDSLERDLRQLGDQAVPDPDAAFATALEDRLRSVAHLQSTEPAPVRRAAGRRVRQWQPALAGGLALAVLAAGFALARPGRDEPLRVAAASNSLVVLPDGTVDGLIPGSLLPDGSTLQTGDDGHLVAGGVELGPNRSGHVDGGAIQPASGGSTIPPPPKPTKTTVTHPTGSTATTSPRAVDPLVPAVGPGPGPEPTVTTVSTRPEPAVTPTSTPTTARPHTTETKPATTPDTKAPGPAVTNSPAPMKLEAQFLDTQVRLRWSAYSGPDFEAYLILRADSPAEPGYPVGDGTTVVARITSQAFEYFDMVKDPAARAYRVVAVNKDRQVVAASGTVRPTPKTASSSA